MLVTVNDAAVMANVSRQTMYRMIKNGDISTSQDRKGRKQIETSELVRVFGTIRELPTRESRNFTRQPKIVSEVSHETHLLQIENAVLKQKLELYEMMREEAKKREERAANQLEKAQQTIDRLTLRLEYTPPPAATQALRKAPSKVVPKKVAAKAKPQPKPSEIIPKTVNVTAVKAVPKKIPAKPTAKVTAKKSALKPKGKR